MELLNMFSDLAPISKNGYREQLYTDPGILQGVEFIQNENKVKREVEQSMDLNLISDSHGTESATVHSAGVLDVEEGFQESMTTSGQEQTMSRYSEELKIQYGIALAKFNALLEEAKKPGKGVIPSPEPVAPAIETPEAKEKRLADDKLAREKLKKDLEHLSLQMANIAAQLMSKVKYNTGREFSSYNRMQKEIDRAQQRIIEVHTMIESKKNRSIHDIDTSMAKEHETSLLTKQRYYVYMLWFVILVIILYITITNLVDSESSFSVLTISLILLIILFLFFLYSQWNAEWYDLKNKLKNLNFSLPEIPKIDFNPLVSIRYTS